MKLNIYRNDEELHKTVECYKKEGKNTFLFEFKLTGDRLLDEPNQAIIITTLVYYLEKNKSDIYSAINNFKWATAETIFLAKEECLNLLHELLPLFFDEEEFLFEEHKSETRKPIVISPKTAYYFRDKSQLEKVVAYCREKQILLIDFSKVSNSGIFSSLSKEDTFLIHWDSVLYALEDNKNLIYLSHQMMDNYSNSIALFHKENLDVVQKYYPIMFQEILPIDNLFAECKVDFLDSSEDIKSKIKICDNSEVEISKVKESIDYNLIGHKNFKKELFSAIDKFIVLNKIGQQKTLSIFTFGESGVGKTELGRIIHSELAKNSPMIKINFGNYSSQDSLNSLIGSPRGYIGCQEGELSKKIKNNKSSVIIFDEMEKACKSVYNFFLELLEDGRFTDSMGEEFDLNGYILVFTSNIKDVAEFNQKIAPEFRSRVDLISHFAKIPSRERNLFIERVINESLEKYKSLGKKVDNTKIEIIKQKALLVGDNLREIKKFILGEVSLLL